MESMIALGSTPAKTLREAALVPEGRTAIHRWLRLQPKATHGVLIGGLALAFYSKPRATQDVYLLFDSSVPDVNNGFKVSRHHAAIDRETHVEMEFVTPTTIVIPKHVAYLVISTAIEIDGLKVAALDSLIVLKLFGADARSRRRQDKADIQSLLYANRNVSLKAIAAKWSLSQDHIARLHSIAADVEGI